MKDGIKLAFFALTAAYVALLPQFYEIFDRENRFTLLWDHQYHAAILSAVIVLGAFYGAAYAIMYLAWRPSPSVCLARDVLLVMFMLGLVTRTAVSILDRSGHLSGPLAFLNARGAKVGYYLVFPLLIVAINPFVAKRAVRRLYACLAPMTLMGLLWPLTYQTFDVRSPPIPADLARQLTSGPTRGTTNVFIFLLDEWSYDRTFPGGKLLDEMPRLRGLLAQATLYSDARAPGPTTAVSIPRILFQNNEAFARLSYEQVKAAALHREPIPGPTLFSESPPGFYKMAIGFWIAYPSMLGTNVEFAATIHQEAGTRTYALQTKTLLFSQSGWLRHFGAKNPQKALHPSLVWIHSQVQAHRWALETIGHMSQPTYAFFHYCLPHYPYVWDANGLKEPLPEDPVVQAAENYRGNLIYLDRVIGELIDALQESGKFDPSMLILTSDHSWRHDPDRDYGDLAREDEDPHSNLRHVPLVVKFPHQVTPGEVKTRVSLDELHLIIRRGLEAARNPDGTS